MLSSQESDAPKAFQLRLETRTAAQTAEVASELAQGNPPVSMNRVAAIGGTIQSLRDDNSSPQDTLGTNTPQWVRAEDGVSEHGGPGDARVREFTSFSYSKRPQYPENPQTRTQSPTSLAIGSQLERLHHQTEDPLAEEHPDRDISGSPETRPTTEVPHERHVPLQTHPPTLSARGSHDLTPMRPRQSESRDNGGIPSTLVSEIASTVETATGNHAEETRNKTTAVKDIRIGIPVQTREVQVHVSESGGEIHLDVRSSDPTARAALRDSLQDLVRSLDRHGFSTSEGSNVALPTEPVSIAHRDQRQLSSDQASNSDNGDHSRGHQHWADRRQHRRGHNEEWLRWMEKITWQAQFSR